MNEQQINTAKLCKQASIEGNMDFGQIVMKLAGAGFERYTVDFCGGQTSYYLPSGENVTLPFEFEEIPKPENFDISAIKVAIRNAQTKAEGYTYKKFCHDAMKSGCIGYIVSFLGKRVIYFGRTGDMHIEYFPR